MIHAKISSPLCTSIRKRRQTNSGKTFVQSDVIPQDAEANQSESHDPVPIRYLSFYKQGKTQIDIDHMFKRKITYPVAPDAFIPNSSFRTIFKRKEIKPDAVEVFQLRLDILKNLQKIDDSSSNCQDDEFEKVTDPNAVGKTANTKKLKGSLPKTHNGPTSEDATQNKYWNKDALPDLFKRMRNETWWKQAKDDKPNLISMLLYLKDIIKLKQVDSYESACYYVIEIFRSYGIESLFVNQILDILLNHLQKHQNDRLDICTMRTIAQFMIERKDLIIQLLEYALPFQPNDPLRLEVTNAIKFITDVNNTNEIDLVLDHISVAHDYPEDNFSLKMIIKSIETMPKMVISEVVQEDEDNNEVHPLLKKISKERWFPQGKFPITLDYVLDAIITKLQDTTKTLIKTLTSHLVQVHHVFGYSKEQFDRVSDILILLLSHDEADYRLIAATNLAHFNRETKAIDIALLHAFISDSRILVRTECCDSLKILTGIASDTVLQDCADDISYLQNLPEENFRLQNYLKEKHRVSTASPSIEEPLIIPIEEESILVEEIQIDNQLATNVTITSRTNSRSTSPQIVVQPAISNGLTLAAQCESTVSSSPMSSATPVQPLKPVQIDTKQNTVLSISENQSMSSMKTSTSFEINKKRPSLLSTTWNSYTTENNDTEQKEIDESQFNFYSPSQAILIDDSFQTIIEQHKQMVGFYRMRPNRPVLIPHRITMDDVFGDQSHMIINRRLPQLHHVHQQQSIRSPLLCGTNSMSLLDFNHNQQYLHETESIQLLSSLVVRSIQIHRQHDRCVPESFSANFTNLLNISPIQLNPAAHVNASLKLPPIVHSRQTSRQYAQIQSNVQTKALREGINVYKAQNIEGELSNILKSNHEQTTTILPSSTSSLSDSKLKNITHARLLAELLKSQRIFSPESYLEKIVQSYPKFLPLLHTKIPSHLISTIWNDPILRQIASIFSAKQNEIINGNYSMQRSDPNILVPVTDDEYSLNSFDYVSLIHRDDYKKKYLPSIRNPKISFQRQVLKVRRAELEINSTGSSVNSVQEMSKSRLHKGRAYMNMSPNDHMVDQHESLKHRSQPMIIAGYQTTSLPPIVVRVPMCH